MTTKTSKKVAKKAAKKTTKKAGKKTGTKKARRSGVTTSKTFLHEVPVVLTETERIKRGEAMTKQMQEKESMIGMFDLERKEHNARVKEKETEIEQHRRAFDRKTENRRVKCKWRHDWAKGEKTLIRTDLTGKAAIVMRSTITAEERQLDLDKVAAKNKAAAKKAEDAKKKKAAEEAEKNGTAPTLNDDQPLAASIAERTAAAGKDPKKDPPKKPEADAKPADGKAPSNEQNAS